METKRQGDQKGLLSMSLPPWIRDVPCVGDKSWGKWKADLPLQQETSSPVVKMSWLIKVNISLKSKVIPKRHRSGLRVLSCLHFGEDVGPPGLQVTASSRAQFQPPAMELDPAPATWGPTGHGREKHTKGIWGPQCQGHNSPRDVN